MLTPTFPPANPLPPAPPARVALVMATDPYGRVLLGLRDDNQRWTLPGGHLEPGETPEAAAARELAEETGLQASALTLLGVTPPAGPGYPVLYRFSALVSGTPHGRDDPDAECARWEFVDARGGIPANIWDALHGPAGDANWVRQAFELRKGTTTWTPGGFADLRKAEPRAARSEVGDLLTHPDPRERVLALKLDSCTPADVARAVLDPHPDVWFAALQHPHGAHARDALAAASRDAAGAPIWDRHDALLQHPELRARHLAAMYRSARDAADLPEGPRALRLAALVSHPWMPAGVVPTGGVPLVKHWGHEVVARTAVRVDTPTDFAGESYPDRLQHLHEAYERGIGGAAPVQPEDADLASEGVASPKVVYRVPVAGSPDPQRVLVKPYHQSHHTPLAGWAELTSQALYQAAGIGGLHQEVVPVMHGVEDVRVPAVAIRVVDGVTPTEVAPVQIRSANPGLALEAQQLAMMDFLMDNDDREGNLLVRPDGHLLAIDHGEAFAGAVNFQRCWMPFADLAPPPGVEAFAWWERVRGEVAAAFEARLQLVTDPAIRARIQAATARAAAHLDRWAAKARAGTLPVGWMNS